MADEFDANPTMTDTDSTPAASSPAAETTPTPTENQPSSGSDAQSPSSGDTPLSDREGLLAAVRSVVKVQDTPAHTGDIPQDGAATQGQDTDTAGTTGADPGALSDPRSQTPLPDPTEADLRKLRPETRRRFEQLLGQRDEARQALASLQPELDQHRQLRGYLEQNQLAPDDVNLLLGVGASLRRGDFQAFLNGVMPYVQAAQEALGLRFSPDLQSQVDDGLITEDTAREVTQARFRANQAEGRLQEQTNQREQEHRNQAVQAVRVAVTDWENNVRKSDPDYALKAVAVQRFSQALMQERGVPATPDQALRLVQDAYQEATAQFARARPAPRPTRVSPPGINGVAHAAAPEPRSMKDVALMALANMRRAS